MESATDTEARAPPAKVRDQKNRRASVLPAPFPPFSRGRLLDARAFTFMAEERSRRRWSAGRLVGRSLGRPASQPASRRCRHFSHEEGFSHDHCRRYSLSSTSRRLPVTGVHCARTDTLRCPTVAVIAAVTQPVVAAIMSRTRTHSPRVERARHQRNDSPSRSISGKTSPPDRKKPASLTRPHERAHFVVSTSLRNSRHASSRVCEKVRWRDYSFLSCLLFNSTTRTTAHIDSHFLFQPAIYPGVTITPTARLLSSYL